MHVPLTEVRNVPLIRPVFVSLSGSSGLRTFLQKAVVCLYSTDKLGVEIVAPISRYLSSSELSAGHAGDSFLVSGFGSPVLAKWVHADVMKSLTA